MSSNSDKVKSGLERAPHRGLMWAAGFVKNAEDFKKPFIAVVNSYTDVVPGHAHLHEVAKIVKKAIRDAGGVPIEFNTIAICDGIAMGHTGMKYSLASRELIADTVESMLRAHCFDGMVCIPNCDKIIPGMLMASMRLNLPTIFVSGGPMAAGTHPKTGEKLDLISLFRGVAQCKKGAISEADLAAIEPCACPGVGSCSGMFTANSMNCLTEALGLGLPGNGTILATDPRRKKLFRTAGKRILELVRDNVCPRQIATLNAFKNALVLDMAMGGSTNTILHTIAIAHEAGIQLDLNLFNELSAKTPNICKVSPSCDYHIEDVDKAGGISAILLEISKIKGLLDLKAMTVTGKTLGKNIRSAKILDTAVIHPLENAYSKEGGLAMLFGNLAPEGAVVKSAGVKPEMLRHQGPAICFDSQEAACEGLLGGKVKPGMVVVIRYEGPKGGPGMQEMLAPTSYIQGLGLDDKCALITDGRFSGGTAGAAIGHVSPEAASGGLIGLIKDGDMIAIDIPERKLKLQVAEAELAQRKAVWVCPPPKVTEGWLVRYARQVTSGSRGAVLE